MPWTLQPCCGVSCCAGDGKQSDLSEFKKANPAVTEPLERHVLSTPPRDNVGGRLPFKSPAPPPAAERLGAGSAEAGWPTRPEFTLDDVGGVVFCIQEDRRRPSAEFGQCAAVSDFTEGHEHDAEWGNEFVVDVTQDKEQKLGLALILIQEDTLMVGGILQGVAQSWNALSAAAKQIRPGDRIVEVNGKKVPSLILKHTTVDTHLHMTLRRPRRWKVRVERPFSSESLGLRCAHDVTSVMVLEIKDGPFRNWNTLHPDKEVHVNDRILQVNQLSGSADAMLNEMQVSAVLEMLIARCV